MHTRQITEQMDDAFCAVLRIRGGFSIPYPGSRVDKIPDQRFFTQRKIRVFFSDPGSWMLDLDFFLSRIPDPGVKKAPDPGSGSAVRNTAFWELTTPDQ
jgi:hypothetical protein